jgi:hypothetical protein
LIERHTPRILQDEHHPVPVVIQNIWLCYSM